MRGTPEYAHNKAAQRHDSKVFRYHYLLPLIFKLFVVILYELRRFTPSHW